MNNSSLELKVLKNELRELNKLILTDDAVSISEFETAKLLYKRKQLIKKINSTIYSRIAILRLEQVYLEEKYPKIKKNFCFFSRIPEEAKDRYYDILEELIFLHESIENASYLKD